MTLDIDYALMLASLHLEMILMLGD